MKMWKIYALLTTAMLIWGFNLPLLKYLLLYVGPVTMTTFRILLASITVFIILAPSKLIRMPTKTEWKYIIGGAFLNVVLHHYFLNMGLERTTGTNAGLILGTGPVLTVISVSLILRNYPSKIQWIGVLLGVVGVSSVVLAGGGLAGLALGDIFVFIAILVQVLSFLVISKAARTLDPRLMTAYMMVIGSVSIIHHQSHPRTRRNPSIRHRTNIILVSLRGQRNHRHRRRTHALQLLRRKSRPVQSRYLHQLQHLVLTARLRPFPRRNHHRPPPHRLLLHHRRRHTRIRRSRRPMEKTETTA